MLLIPIFAIISLITFILYGVDKRRSIKGAWRIPERVLLLFSFLGGAVGGTFAMNTVRHKTKHWYFWVVNIVGLLLHIVIAVWIVLFLNA